MAILCSTNWFEKESPFFLSTVIYQRYWHWQIVFSLCGMVKLTGELGRENATEEKVMHLAALGTSEAD
jgi:hypothetical protein